MYIHGNSSWSCCKITIKENNVNNIRLEFQILHKIKKEYLGLLFLILFISKILVSLSFFKKILVAFNNMRFLFWRVEEEDNWKGYSFLELLQLAAANLLILVKSTRSFSWPPWEIHPGCEASMRRLRTSPGRPRWGSDLLTWPPRSHWPSAGGCCCCCCCCYPNHHQSWKGEKKKISRQWLFLRFHVKT